MLAVSIATDEANLRNVAWFSVLYRLVFATLIYCYILDQVPFTSLAMALAYTIGIGFIVAANLFFFVRMYRSQQYRVWKSASSYYVYATGLVLEFIVFVSWYWVYLGGQHNQFRKHPDHNKIPHADDNAFYIYQSLNVVFLVFSVVNFILAITYIFGGTDVAEAAWSLYLKPDEKSGTALFLTVLFGCLALVAIMFNGLFAYWVLLGFDPMSLWGYMSMWIATSLFIAISFFSYMAVREVSPADAAQLVDFYRGHWQSFNVIMGFLITWWSLNFGFWIHVWANGVNMGQTVDFNPTLPTMQKYFLYTYYDLSFLNAVMATFALYYLFTIICAARMMRSGDAVGAAGADKPLIVASGTISQRKMDGLLYFYYGAYHLSFIYDLLVAAFTLAELQEKFFISRHFHEWTISYAAIHGFFALVFIVIAVIRLFYNNGGAVTTGMPEKCSILRTTATNVLIYFLSAYGAFWIHARFDDPDFTRTALRTPNLKNPILFWNLERFLLATTFLKLIMFVDIRTFLQRPVSQVSLPFILGGGKTVEQEA